MTFVGDYRPTKRVGVEELQGCVRLLEEAAAEMRDDGVAGAEWYMGAWLALSLMLDGRFEYPQDFMAVFENKLQELNA